MAQRITWSFIERSFFPLVVNDAKRAGMDVTGWALDTREGPGRMFCRIRADRSVETVYHRFATAADADRFFQGVRWTLARVPAGEIEL